MIGDPATAPPRSDLAYLRRRSSRRMTTVASGATDTGSLAEFVAGHAHHQHAGSTPPSSSSSLDLGTGSAPARPVVSSLDLGTGSAPARPVVSSLDLDESATPAFAPAAPAQGPRRPPPPARTAPRRPPVTRVANAGRLVLDAATPAVTLTRVQSGIGTLTVEAACGRDVGDLRLGCAYRLRDGATSVISTRGERTAPAGARQPVLVAGHEQFDRISVDLRRVRDISRLMFYAFSESRSALNWAGTLVVTTHAGGRVEAPLIGLDAGSVGVLLSAYQVDGELALWTEMLAGANVSGACRAFGFDDITWVDDRTPVN